MKTYPFLDLKVSNAPFVAQLQAAAADVIASGRYLRDEQTALLEQEIAALCHTEHCVAVSNGLDALRLILRAYKEMGFLHDGDKVITQANTYIATILAITDNNLQPCLCEPSELTMNLDSNRLEDLITPDVKAIMPVHLYGSPCWDQTLVDVAKKHHLLIIEDNAQAIGARSSCDGLWSTRATGGLGHAGALSFYPTKNLGALGDAGAVVTNDKSLADAVRAIANYGSDFRYHNVFQGLNCRIDELQAAMLRVKLPYLHEENRHRAEIAAIYDHYIQNPLIKKPQIFHDERQVWHQYVIRTPEREALTEYLNQNGIGWDIHYATPPHMQPCYRRFATAELPLTTRLSHEVVSLPITHTGVSDAKEIASIISKFKC